MSEEKSELEELMFGARELEAIGNATREIGTLHLEYNVRSKLQAKLDKKEKSLMEDMGLVERG